MRSGAWKGTSAEDPTDGHREETWGRRRRPPIRGERSSEVTPRGGKGKEESERAAQDVEPQG